MKKYISIALIIASLSLPVAPVAFAQERLAPDSGAVEAKKEAVMRQSEEVRDVSSEAFVERSRSVSTEVVEEETVFTGTLEVEVSDDFLNSKNSKTEYFINTGTERIKIDTNKPINSRSGARVRVSGEKTGDRIVAPRQNIELVGQAPVPVANGTQEVAVFLIGFQNSGPVPFGVNEADSIVFDEHFQDFYDEQSYGKIRFDGDVFDWYTLNKNGTCQLSTLSFTDEEIEEYVNARDVDLSKYERILILVNNKDSCTHPVGGKSTVGKKNITINDETYNLSISKVDTKLAYDSSGWDLYPQPFEWRNIDFIMSHEIGHALGLEHATGWDCGNETLGDECEELSYGDGFDAMAAQGFALHFNVFEKELMKWLKPHERISINHSGQYSMAAQNLPEDTVFSVTNVLDGSDLMSILFDTSDTADTMPSATSSNEFFGKKYARIVVPGEVTYYLEFRKGVGYDSNLNRENLASNQEGLLIRRVLPTEGNDIPYTQLLDMSPDDQGWKTWYDDIEAASLNAGMTFHDEENDITISGVQVAGDTVNFDVEMN